MSISETVEESSLCIMEAMETGDDFKTLALYYARMGYHVFPLTAHKKQPIKGGGVTTATTDKATISKWFSGREDYNIAIAGGHGVVIIDVDVKEGKDGVADIERIFADAGEPSPIEFGSCPMVKTPSGGYHLFYHCENSAEYISKVEVEYNGEKTALDVRADRTYVVAAPSWSDSGGRYVWERLPVPVAELPELPECLKKVLPKKGDKATPTGKPQSDFRDRITTPIPNTGISATDRDSRIRAYICSADPAEQGKDGSGTTFGVLGRLWWGFALSEDELRQWAHVYNAERCDPTWSENELEHKIESVLNRWQPIDGRPRGHLWTESRRNGVPGGDAEFDRMIANLCANAAAKRKATSTQQETPAMSENDDNQPLGIPFDDLHKDEVFPVDAFPKEARAFVEWTARSFNQPCEAIGYPLLGLVSGLIGNKRVLRVRDGWLVPSPIWVLLYGASTSGKSPVLQSVISLIDKYDKAKIEEFNGALGLYEQRMAEYRKDLADFNKKSKRLTEQMRKQEEAEAIGASAVTEDTDTEDECEDVPADAPVEVAKSDSGDSSGNAVERKKYLFDATIEYPEPPELPEMPFNESFMVESATIEGVRKKMGFNGGRVLLFDDEFEGFTGSFDQYNKGKGVANAFWNKTYNRQTARLTLASSKDVVISNATASLLGGVQTEVFEGKKFLKNEDYLANGFLARYMILGIERKRIGRDCPTVPEWVISDMETVIKYLLDMRWNGDEPGKKPSRNFDPVVTDMDSEAADLFWADKNFYDDWMDSRQNDHFTSMIGKIQGRTARIALALWCLRGEPRGAGGAWGLVDKATMEAAIRINFHNALEWYNTFYGLKENMAEQKETKKAEEDMIQMIRDAGGVPKRWVDRDTKLTGEQKRMVKNLVTRGLLVETGRRTDKGHIAKWVTVPE